MAASRPRATPVAHNVSTPLIQQEALEQLVSRVVTLFTVGGAGQ